MDRLTLYSTEIFVFRVPGVEALNSELRALLVAESQQTPSWAVANVGGWHSTPDVAQRSGPFRALGQLFVDHVGTIVQGRCREAGRPAPPMRFKVQAWATVMGPGAYVIAHDHAEAHFSMAYYVDAGDAAESGKLSFMDPRRGSFEIPGLGLDPGTVTVTPETGMLVVFPGPLQHYVHPYAGQRERVCVAANVNVEVQPVRPGA